MMFGAAAVVRDTGPCSLIPAFGCNAGSVVARSKYAARKSCAIDWEIGFDERTVVGGSGVGSCADIFSCFFEPFTAGFFFFFFSRRLPFGGFEVCRCGSWDVENAFGYRLLVGPR